MQDSYLANDLQRIIHINASLLRLKSQIHITLPSITVIGFISIGKSSTIEQLTGLEYLPYDPISYNIRTSFPYEIHFQYTPHAQQFYAHIDGLLENGSPKVLTTAKEISEQIRKITFHHDFSRRYGKEAIHLRIFSAHCPTVTVIDMPGLNLFEEYRNLNNRVTRQILMHYLKDSYSVLLTVIHPSMQRAEKSILYYSSQVDPTQMRSVGCLTKIDLMDRGTNAVGMLSNQYIPLRYGYVAIKNRNSQDRIRLSLEEGLKEEQKYFADRPIYSKLPSQLCGTASLSKKLVFAIYRQIKPQLKSTHEFIRRKREEIMVKISHQCSCIKQSPVYYLKSVKDTLSSIRDNICDAKDNNNTAQAIRIHFFNYLKKESSMSPTECISDKQLKKQMSKTCSCCSQSIPGVYMNTNIFQYLIVGFLKKYRKCALEMTKRIHQLLKEEVDQLIGQEQQVQQSLQARQVLQKVTLYLFQNHAKLDVFLIELFESEYSFFFTNDPAFFQENFYINARTGKSSSTQQQFRQRIDSYLRIVINNLRDTVPKQIIHFLFAKTIKQLKQELEKVLEIAVMQNESGDAKKQLAQIIRLQQIMRADDVMMSVIEQQDKIEVPKANQIAEQEVAVKKLQQQKDATVKKIQQQQMTINKQESNQTTTVKKYSFNRLFGL